MEGDEEFFTSDSISPETWRFYICKYCNKHSRPIPYNTVILNTEQHLRSYFGFKVPKVFSRKYNSHCALCKKVSHIPIYDHNSTLTYQKNEALYFKNFLNKTILQLADDIKFIFI